MNLNTPARVLHVAVIAALVVGGLSLSTESRAGTDSANLGVSASVSANCTIVANAVAFGAYDPVEANLSADKDQSGSVDVRCTNGSAAAISLGQGANADTGSTNTDPARRMIANGADYLSYDLYSDSGRNTEWGNDTDSDLEITGTGDLDNYEIFGTIPAGQTAAKVGSYSDTVVATVTF